MVKKIGLSILFVFAFITVNAQNWNTNFEEAKNIASKNNQNIILVFQGSDWCAPCIKLDREIWSTPEFINYANQHFTLLKADFPRKSKNKLTKIQQEQNNHLMETYNKQGFFPFVAVLNKNGDLLGATGYKKTSPSKYIKLLNSFN